MFPIPLVNSVRKTEARLDFKPSPSPHTKVNAFMPKGVATSDSNMKNLLKAMKLAGRACSNEPSDDQDGLQACKRHVEIGPAIVHALSPQSVKVEATEPEPTKAQTAVVAVAEAVPPVPPPPAEENEDTTMDALVPQQDDDGDNADSPGLKGNAKAIADVSLWLDYDNLPDDTKDANNVENFFLQDGVDICHEIDRARLHPWFSEFEAHIRAAEDPSHQLEPSDWEFGDWDRYGLVWFLDDSVSLINPVVHLILAYV